MDEKIDSREISEGKKGGMNAKVFIIGLPIFIIQLVAVYFILGNIMLSRFKTHNEAETAAAELKADGHGKGEKKGAEGSSGPSNFFFTVDDVIINPAGTNGQRLMLVSVGFGVATDEAKKKLSEKEVLVKDIVISTLSCKKLEELNQVGYKDTLKVQLSKSLNDIMPDAEINSVVFSKYIIQ